MFKLKRASAAPLMTLAAVLACAGCSRDSGNKPQPSNPQGSATLGARQIEVHTEDDHGQRIKETRANCFLEDDHNTVVVAVTADEIQSEKNIALTLWGVSKNKILFPNSGSVKSGKAEFRFTHAIKAIEEHLGPGPYVATADIGEAVLHSPIIL